MNKDDGFGGDGGDWGFRYDLFNVIIFLEYNC